MADYLFSSVDSIIIGINVNDVGTNSFLVQHKVGAGYPAVLTVAEDKIVFTESLARDGTLEFNNTSGSGNIVDFESGNPDTTGSVVASIDSSGKGIFDQRYIRLLRFSNVNNPNGSLSGTAGDMVLWVDGFGNYLLLVCAGGTAWAQG